MPIPSSPDLLANVLGYAADLNSIPATTPSGSGAFSYQAGFPAITGFPLTAGGIAPSRQDFNGVFNLIGQHLFFLQSGSLYPWSASLDYLVGAHVLGSDGKEYIAQKSSGPDVPSAPAVNPVGDDSGTWLVATLAYGAPLATSSSPGLMQPDGITTFVNSSGVLSTALDPSWIGVPRYWRSTNLPPNHCWANGDFVEFADWPELEQVYNAGGFAGMLMAWDADSGTKAANLGKWRPDAANPTGLYTPNLSGQFFRNWGPDQSERPSGSWQGDALQGHWHSITDDNGRKFAGYTDGGNGPGWGAGWGETQVQARAIISADGYGLPRVAIETRPVNISQPVILYLGRPA